MADGGQRTVRRWMGGLATGHRPDAMSMTMHACSSTHEQNAVFTDHRRQSAAHGERPG
jgi:hypothetical protein